MSLGLRFYMSRKGGTGGGGWVHQKDESSMFSLAMESPWSEPAGALLLYGMDLENSPPHQ